MARPKKATPAKTSRSRPSTKPPATPAGPKTAARKPPDDIAVPVNAALRAEWDAELTLLKSSALSGAEAFDRKYEAIARIVEHKPPLYLAGGYETFKAFASEFLHEDTKQVTDWMAVAKRATPAEEAKYSPTRMALLLSLLRVQSKDHSLPKSVEWSQLQVSYHDHKGRLVKKRAVDASLSDIRAARAEVLVKAGKRAASSSPEADAVQGTLGDRVFENVEVRYRDGTFAFTGVPGFALGRFAELIATAKWEAADDAVNTPNKAAAQAPKRRATKRRKKG